MTTGLDTPTVFGKVHLGYVVIESQKFSDWRRFGKDAIGMHVDDVTNDDMRFRLDDHHCRFLLHRGPAEDATAVGWHVDDHDTFDEIVARLASCDVPVAAGTEHETALRGVERLLRFPGPKGLTQEIYTHPLLETTPLDMQTSAFVTGDGGIGHIVYTSKEPEKIRAYYNTVLDARLTDYIDETINGLKLKIRFLRVNERHHSVAIAAIHKIPVDPIPTRIQHLNIQVATLDDMTSAYQRVNKLGFDMALGVGQHTNDRELSFYAKTPSGFEWEVGWNPIVVTESTWEATTHQGISVWGHTPVGHTVIDILNRFKVAARSIRDREDTVPAITERGLAGDDLARGDR